MDVRVEAGPGVLGKGRAVEVGPGVGDMPVERRPQLADPPDGRAQVAGRGVDPGVGQPPVDQALGSIEPGTDGGQQLGVRGGCRSLRLRLIGNLPGHSGRGGAAGQERVDGNGALAGLDRRGRLRHLDHADVELVVRAA